MVRNLLSEMADNIKDDGQKYLPTTASLWKRRHLQNLKITIDESAYRSSDPKEIIKTLVKYKPTQDYETWTNRISDLNNHIAKLKKAIEKTKAYSRSIDVSFDDLTMEKGIIDMLATEDDMWEIHSNFLEDHDQPQIKRFKPLFEEAGKKFTERLIRCIHLKDNNQTVSECMYQHLFISFLQLFNIRCQYVPYMLETSMDICGQTIKGTPDMSVELLEFCSNTSNISASANWKFLTLCKVKKELQREQPPEKKRRTSDDTEDIHHLIHDDLLGQHGADLLLHYPSSVSNDTIIGIMIEQTHITFTALSMTKEQFEQIKNGTLKVNKGYGPKLYLTRSYDYLVWKDRICLTEALLTLGYLQNCGQEYFFK